MAGDARFEPPKAYGKRIETRGVRARRGRKSPSARAAFGHEVSFFAKNLTEIADPREHHAGSRGSNAMTIRPYDRARQNVLLATSDTQGSMLKPETSSTFRKAYIRNPQSPCWREPMWILCRCIPKCTEELRMWTKALSSLM